MRTSAWITGAALLVFVGLFAPRVFTNTQTVTGRLIDLVCYAQDKDNTGNHHKGRGLNCALACVKGEGAPVGILTADGTLYQVTGPMTADNNAKLAPHLLHKVTITGDVGGKSELMTIAATDLKTVAAQ